MKKTRLKQAGIVAAVTVGMLLTSVHTTFALTEENPDTALIESGIQESGSELIDNTNIETNTNLTEEALSSQETVPEAAVSEDTSGDASAPDSTSEDASAPDTTMNHGVVSDPTQGQETGSSEDTSKDSGDIKTDTDSSQGDSISDDQHASTDKGNISETDKNAVKDEASDNQNTDKDGEASDNQNTDKDEEASKDPSAEDKDASQNPSGKEEDIPSDTGSDSAVSNGSLPDSDISSSTNTSGSSGTAQTPASPQVNVSHQEKKPSSAGTVKYDNSAAAVYVQPVYNVSELFIDIEDRIKYNTALPIDNIPSFITQEMIIGALKCQDETGYPASVTIAQIIQESGFGKYGPGGDDCLGLSYLAYEYCNLFGIKGTGTAGSVNMRTGEQASSGEYYTITAGFRVYNTYTECIEDRTKLLKEVYSDLTAGVTDANTFAMRIGSRWATSLTYSKNLIYQMEKYDLYRLDKMTLKDFSEMIGKFADPCPGSYLTSSFGYRTFDDSFHKGIDLGTNGSTIPTYAAESGTVIIAGYNASAGNWIVIDHGNGLVTKYMHHSHIFVKAGDEVEKGQQIGLTGNTGNSFGIHLHFQVEENGVAVDPTVYLPSYAK